MKKMYGFNFQWMHIYEPGRKPEKADLKALDFMAGEGFNFIRIPADYRFFMRETDGFSMDEEVMEIIDGYIEEANKRDIHVSFNFHRAPGYCINSPELEKKNLWKDEEALQRFSGAWAYFAKRYKGISSEKLSFDLLNEPCSIPPTHPGSREDHERVMRTTIAAIRAEDPGRRIVIDGWDGGRTAMPEFLDLRDENLIESGRGYEPHRVTHWHAGWLRGGSDWPMTEYPGHEIPGDPSTPLHNIDTLREYYAPWIALEKAGMQVHIGEFGAYDKLPNDIVLRWYSDLLSLYREYGWGYAMWNFEGPFGIVNTGRPGTRYEEYKGYSIDKELYDMITIPLK